MGCRHSISGISVASPFPSFKALFSGSVQQKQDSKAAMILSLSMLELCLIIAANNVIVNGQMNGTCNFEVCYEEYRKFVLGTNNKVDWCVDRPLSLSLALPSPPSTHPSISPHR